MSHNVGSIFELQPSQHTTSQQRLFDVGCLLRKIKTSQHDSNFFECYEVVSFLLQSNLDGLNTDDLFTMAKSNPFLSPYEILPIAQENKYLRNFSYFIVKLYVECTH